MEYPSPEEDQAFDKSHDAKTVLTNLGDKIGQMDTQYFPLQTFFTLQQALATYPDLYKDPQLHNTVDALRESLQRKNPLGEIFARNHGYALIHSG